MRYTQTLPILFLCLGAHQAFSAVCEEPGLQKAKSLGRFHSALELESRESEGSPLLREPASSREGSRGGAGSADPLIRRLVQHAVRSGPPSPSVDFLAQIQELDRSICSAPVSRRNSPRLSSRGAAAKEESPPSERRSRSRESLEKKRKSPFGPREDQEDKRLLSPITLQRADETADQLFSEACAQVKNRTQKPSKAKKGLFSQIKMSLRKR